MMQAVSSATITSNALYRRKGMFVLRLSWQSASMLKKLLSFSERLAAQIGWIPIITGSSLVAVVSALSGWVAHETAWIKVYGPIAWWFGGLAGAITAVLLLAILSYIRLTLIRGSAIQKWTREVDTINPLDNEFTRRRIRVADLANPVVKSVTKKRFIECELMGPAIIGLKNNISLSHVSFINCDCVLVKPQGAPIHNMIAFDQIEMLGGTINECTIYLHGGSLPAFVAMGVDFVSLTGDPAIDGKRQLPP